MNESFFLIYVKFTEKFIFKTVNECTARANRHKIDGFGTKFFVRRVVGPLLTTRPFACFISFSVALMR